MDRFGNPREDADDARMYQEAQQFSVVSMLLSNNSMGKGSSLVTGNVAYDTKRKGFWITYTPTISGMYSLNVTFQAWRFDPSCHVKGSPFLVNVTEAPTNAGASKATGVGLTQGKAGVPLNFTIEARDLYNNRRLVGGDDLDVIAYHVDGLRTDYGNITVSSGFNAALLFFPLSSQRLTHASHHMMLHPH